MSKTDYKQWYISGLQALVAANMEGDDEASKALEKISNDELRKECERNTEIYKKHAKVIGQLLVEAGGQPSGRNNPVSDGIAAAGKEMMKESQSDAIYDASSVATAQIGMHYFIAAYGTLASTAKHLGLTEQAQQFKQMSDEIAERDKVFSAIAETEVNESAA